MSLSISVSTPSDYISRIGLSTHCSSSDSFSYNTAHQQGGAENAGHERAGHNLEAANV